MIDRIRQFDLCVGCGLCASVVGEGKIALLLNARGFYGPVVMRPLTRAEDLVIRRTCPGICVRGCPASGHWGCVEEVAEAWAAEPTLRHRAASGGAVSALAIYLLESHTVEGILQVGVVSNGGFENGLVVSRSREEILRRAQSRYAPARVFDRLREILDGGTERYAFIGKPCDVAGMRNFLREFPRYADRIVYCLSIFCAGMPSYEGTRAVCRQSGHTDDPLAVRYRGDGWPGTFRADFADGTHYETSYVESWGKVLSHHLPFRCKVCPDGIGMLADIAVGDSWATVSGYPDFTEAEGRSFCLVRTTRGQELMRAAEDSGCLVARRLTIGEIQFKQPYQFERRKLTGWRLLPVQIITHFMLTFTGLSVARLALKADWRRGLREAWGTWKRMVVVIRGYAKQ